MQNAKWGRGLAQNFETQNIFTFLPKIYFGTYRENIINYYIKDKIVKRKQVNDSLQQQQVTIHYGTITRGIQNRNMYVDFNTKQA